MDSDNRMAAERCPARMSDARLFTTWLPNDRYHHMLARKYGIRDMGHEFRHFMVRNADLVKAEEDRFFRERYMCSFHSPKALQYTLFQRE